MVQIVGVIPGGALSKASQSAYAEGPNGNLQTEKAPGRFHRRAQ